MSKKSKKTNKKINRPVPVVFQNDDWDYEGEDLNDGSHFGPYDDEFVDHANSNLNTTFASPILDNSKYYKDFYKPRPIHNYDFYNAFREYREMEKKYSNDGFLDASWYDNYKLYKLKYFKKEKRIQNRICREMERYDKATKAPGIYMGVLYTFTVVMVVITFTAIISSGYEIIHDDSDSNLAQILKFILGSGALFGIIMLLRWARNKVRYNKIKSDFDDSKKEIGDNTPDVHPYVRLCNNLVFMEDKGINFAYPTKKIDENYKRYKEQIEAEWKLTSHKFITNRFFRMKAFDCRFPNYNHYRFFVEVKYDDCFPDYPELINIEKQLEFLPFIPKDDIRPKASLANYKSMLKKKVAELIAERIPKMKVREIIVSAGCTRHNSTPKPKKFKANSDKPFFMQSESDKDDMIVLKNEFYENLEKNDLLKK